MTAKNPLAELRRLYGRISYTPWHARPQKVFARGAETGQVIVCETMFSNRETDMQFIALSANLMDKLLAVVDAAGNLSKCVAEFSHNMTCCAERFEHLDIALNALTSESED